MTKKLTEEQKKKISASQKKRFANPENRIKHSLATRGCTKPNRKSPVPFSKEHRSRLSKSLKKWWSKAENKQRMSDIHKKSWNEQGANDN